MIKSILTTNYSWLPCLNTQGLGIVIFPHGAQKLFGWFGGAGFQGTMTYFIETLGLPWIVSSFTIILESIGALAFFAGSGRCLFASGGRYSLDSIIS